MLPKISRALFSNLLWKSSHSRKCPNLENSPCSLALAHFSTVPNGPMRGGDRRRDDQGNLNFDGGGGGGGGGGRGRDDGENFHQNPGPRSPNRPFRGGGGDPRFMRGDRRGDQRPHQNRSFRQNNGERDRLGDTLLDNLNFGDMGGHKRADDAQIRTHVSTRVAVPDPSVAPEAPPEDADVIFKKMKETGLIPNAVAMLDGLCKDGLVQEAMKLFGLMREKGTIPEVVIYTAVVEGFCKAAKFDDAKRIFRKMQKNGIVPNAISYGTAIQGFCRGKRLEDAVEFCMEMLDAGHSPNAATLTALVSGFCNEKGGEEAVGFVRSLREKGFAIDEKAVREYLDKKGPYSPMVWEAIFGKKNSQRHF